MTKFLISTHGARNNRIRPEREICCEFGVNDWKQTGPAAGAATLRKMEPENFRRLDV